MPVGFATPPRSTLLSTRDRVYARLGITGEDAKTDALLEAASAEYAQAVGYGLVRAEVLETFDGVAFGHDRVFGWAPILSLEEVLFQGSTQSLSGFAVIQPLGSVVRSLVLGWPRLTGGLDWSVRYWAGWLTPADDFTTEALAFNAAGKTLTLSAGSWPLLVPGDRIGIAGSDDGHNDKALTVVDRTGLVVTVLEDVTDEAEGEEITVSVSNLPADIEQAVIERLADLRSGSTSSAAGEVTSREVDGAKVTYSTSSTGSTRVSAYSQSVARRMRVPM